MGIVLAWFGVAVVAGFVLGPILHGLDRPVRTGSAPAGRRSGGRRAASGGQDRSTHVA
jgi:hypothetical protein